MLIEETGASFYYRIPAIRLKVMMRLILILVPPLKMRT